MKRRDLAWRAAGVVLTATACALCLASAGSPLVVVFFPLTLIGLPLTIHGKRVPQALRAERRGHGSTIDAVHAARLARRVG